jgi:hypothetical protein
MSVDPTCTRNLEVGAHMCAHAHRIYMHGGISKREKSVHYVRACRLHNCAFVRGYVLERHALERTCKLSRRTWVRACVVNRHAYVCSCGVNRHTRVHTYGLNNCALEARLTGVKLIFFDVVDGPFG